MSINRLSTNHLQCLNALLLEKSVSKAATRVHLSQSAMSCVLANLREHFNDELLVQVGRSMIPTPFAQSLVLPVKDVLHQLQAISEMKAEFDPLTSERNISIAITDYDVRVHMVKVLQVVWKEAPHMTFRLQPMTSAFQSELDQGDIDIVIVPDYIASDSHPNEFLFKDTYSCVVWKDNSEVGNRISKKKYLELGHVSTKWGKNDYSTFDEEHLTQMGIIRRFEIIAPTLITVPLFVVNTNRVATMTTRLARLMSEQWPLKILECPIDIPPIVEIIQWHKSLNNDPAIRWFRQKVKEVANELAVNTDTLA